MTQEEFIQNIGTLATADMMRTGVLASVTTAQAILESSYGTSILARKANNLFGMKCSLSGNTWPGRVWDGKSRYTKETVEEVNGQKITVTADFRKYDSIEDSIRDHSAYLTGARNGSHLRYPGLNGEKDYRRAIQIIRDGGYATDSLYVSKVCSIIEKWDLTRFDKEEKHMDIIKMISKKNTYIGQNKPAYVVIHETDNWSKGAGAKAHATAMKNGNLAGTVHYYVDSGAIYQTLEHQDGAWAVGDGKGAYGITNKNSINIEICVNPESDYYKAVENAEWLAAKLLTQYGWGTDRLKRHYDASRKHCPRRIQDEGLWPHFVSKVTSYMGGADVPVIEEKFYRIRKSWADADSQIGAYKSLENAKKDWKKGYIIYDWNGKAVYPKAREMAELTSYIEKQFPQISRGCTGTAVSMLQAMLGVKVTGTFNANTEKAFKAFQKNTGQEADGICGVNGWTAVIEHMKANTFR